VYNIILSLFNPFFLRRNLNISIKLRIELGLKID
jgi:hypothetical protein